MSTLTIANELCVFAFTLTISNVYAKCREQFNWNENLQQQDEHYLMKLYISLSVGRFELYLYQVDTLYAFRNYICN